MSLLDLKHLVLASRTNEESEFSWHGARYLAGLSEEVPALPVTLDLTRTSDLADRAVSYVDPARLWGRAWSR